MKRTSIIPVLMCGGSGTRLWPTSRKNYPKQFIVKDKNNQTLFQSTVNQFKSKYFCKPVIITNHDYRFIVSEQLKEINVVPEVIILEPSPKNTLATSIAACLYIQNKMKKGTAIISPTDHQIDKNKFTNDLINNIDLNKHDINLVGISPKSPNTSLGYIQCKTSNSSLYMIKKFIEKPNLKLATKLMRTKNTFWNTGNFVVNVHKLLEIIQTLEPKTLEAVNRSFVSSINDLDYLRLGEKDWNKSKNISLDYSVIEKCNNLAMIKYSGNWFDQGTWKSFYQANKKDKQKNVIFGNSLVSQTKNSLVISDEHIKTVTHNLDDMAVITERDVVFVTKLSTSESLAPLVKKIMLKSKDIALNRTTVHKPWGSYTNIFSHGNYKIKLLIINPFEELSYQSHKYRSEHWVVVNGTASIILDDKKIELKKNMSIFIPAKSKHQLMNNKKNRLEIIEVQIGSYLGEDDIIRYKDKYSR